MLSNDSTTPPADLSPIATCLRIAAQRGRALRLQREAQQQQPADDPAHRDNDDAQPDQKHDTAQATEAAQ